MNSRTFLGMGVTCLFCVPEEEYIIKCSSVSRKLVLLLPYGFFPFATCLRSNSKDNRGVGTGESASSERESLAYLLPLYPHLPILSRPHLYLLRNAGADRVQIQNLTIGGCEWSEDLSL